MRKWTSIHDRLPKAGNLVICGNIDDGWVAAGSINKEGIWFNQFMDSKDDAAIYPTHWRPMPSFQGPAENYVKSGTETFR